MSRDSLKSIITWKKLLVVFKKKLNENTNLHSIQLHANCDLSKNVNAAALYIRSQYETKSKDTPVKQVSLPRLEVCSTLLLQFNCCRLAGETYMGYICRQHSICYRRKYEKGLLWMYVRIAGNPTDPIKRGLKPNNLKEINRWWGGPSRFCQSEKLWHRMSFTYQSRIKFSDKAN